MKERILVIRLGALGDLVLCFQAFADIRKAHPDADIALLTTDSFIAFGLQMPWFDKVLMDRRAPAWRLDRWWQLLHQVRAFAPTRIYDLQGKLRQTILYGLLGGPVGPEWSGAAPLCHLPRLWPPVPGMHFTDFAAAQLQKAGINTGTVVNTSWLEGGLEGFEFSQRYALLIPGCAPGRPYKRWPVDHYAALANILYKDGIAAVAIGAEHDVSVVREIKSVAGHVIDLCGRTNLKQVASLAREAVIVIGNDTGPTHLAAAVGARTLALMSDQVNPLWSAPKGTQTEWLQGKPLATLSVETVLKTLQIS